MERESIQLSAREAARRELMLAGNQLHVLFVIALPLVFYNSLGQVFQLIDTVIAANIGAGVVSTVSFVAQIEKMLMAVGSGLSLAGGILISRSFGAGDLEKVRTHISTLFFMTLIIGGVILAVIIPLMYPLLRLLQMPADLLAQGTIYSSLTVGSIMFQLVNTMYFSIQKSRGNTKVIMWGNLLVLAIKTSLNVTTMTLIRHGAVQAAHGIYLLPVATLTAHCVLTIIAVANLSARTNPFRVSVRYCSFMRTFLSPLAALGVPVFLEKFIFAFGKALVNSLAAGFGSTVVGALGVSDRICGLSTNPITGFQESESSLISNNLGNGNMRRAISFFYRTLIVNMCFILLFFVLTGLFRAQIIGAFAKGDAAFAAEIEKIYRWERLDTILVAVNTSVMGLLYGFGKTKVSMVLNIARLFVYRIPVLLLFLRVPALNTALGIQSVGIAMFVSNGLAGITAGITALVFLHRLRRAENIAR